jgi:hypothetical protein
LFTAKEFESASTATTGGHDDKQKEQVEAKCCLFANSQRLEEKRI